MTQHSVPFTRLLVRAVLLVGSLTLAACGGKGEAPAAAALEVSVVQVDPQDVVIYTDFVGSIDGIENADIRARVAGYLEKVHFKEGHQVKAGDLLFTIDPVLSEAEVRKAQGDLAMARAASSKAKADVERLSPLVATNSVSRQELDHATAAKESADAQIAASQGALASAQAALSFTKVKSPIDGVVGVRKVSIGTLVGQAEPTLLTTVSKLDPVRVRFPISERLYLKHAAALNRLTTADASEAASKLRLELILADGSVYKHYGWLALIDRAVSISTGSILLESRFPNPDGVLRPGQFARVRVATAKVPGALAVPQRAVLERQSLHELYVLTEGNKVERRAATMGEKVGSYWLVEKGLKPGEKVLTEGLQKLKPGMVVVPKDVPLGTVSKPPAQLGGAAAPATSASADPSAAPPMPEGKPAGEAPKKGAAPGAAAPKKPAGKAEAKASPPASPADKGN